VSATNKKDEWREVCVERKSLCGFAGFSQMREKGGNLLNNSGGAAEV
jgi:hypothetical protein